MISDSYIFELGFQILTCARNALVEVDPQGVAEMRFGMVAGDPAWDDCCDGQITGNITRVYPSSSFPDDDAGPFLCGYGYTAFDMDVQVLRCAPTQDNLGRAPMAAELHASALVKEVDARAVYRGVVCCLVNRKSDGILFVMRSQLAAGPDGGCVGSTTSVTVGIEDGCPCS